MVDDYMLDNIKKIIGMEKLDDTKILIEAMVKSDTFSEKCCDINYARYKK